MPSEKKIDEFLDRALAEYSSASAREGLQGRILAGLRAEKPGAPSSWRWTWAAVAVAAAILLFALLWRPAAPTKNKLANVVPPRVTLPATSERVVKMPVAPMHVERVKRPAPNPHRTPTAPKVQQATPRLNTFPSQDGNDELAQLVRTFARTNPALANEVAKEQEEFRETAAAFTAPLEGNEK